MIPMDLAQFGVMRNFTLTMIVELLNSKKLKNN